MSEHPNRLPFRGVLAYVDKPSDKAPSGARGRRVILARAAVEEALHTLIGMAVNFSAAWDNHDTRRLAGVITNAELDQDLLRINGFIYAINFPDLVKKLREEPESLGLSYELHNAHVADMRRSIWTIERVTFTGAAIQMKEKCAYGETSIAIDEQIVPSIAALAICSLGEATSGER